MQVNNLAGVSDLRCIPTPPKPSELVLSGTLVAGAVSAFMEEFDPRDPANMQRVADLMTGFGAGCGDALIANVSDCVGPDVEQGLGELDGSSFQWDETKLPPLGCQQMCSILVSLLNVSAVGLRGTDTCASFAQQLTAALGAPLLGHFRTSVFCLFLYCTTDFIALTALPPSFQYGSITPLSSPYHHATGT